MDVSQFTQGKGCNNRKLTDADRAEVVRLYTTPLPDGTWMGVTSIARRFAVRHFVIQTVLKKHGVQMRSPKEAHRGHPGPPADQRGVGGGGHPKGKRCKPITRNPVGDPPPCACGCGLPVAWQRPKDRWYRYAKGHYNQRGVQNPAYINGRAYEPYVEDWPAISLAIRRRDGFKCQRCRGDSRRLHVHHIDVDKQNNHPSNLITLCATCHGTVHSEMRRVVVG